MTNFHHAKRNGKKKRPKTREYRRSLDIKTLEALVAHRELEYIRNPSLPRLRKLKDSEVALERYVKNGYQA